MTNGRARKFRAKGRESPLRWMCLGSSLKEKKNIWNKICKESAKRDTELYNIIEIAANDEKQEDNERNIIKKTLKQLCKEVDDADEARPLLHGMQQNVEEAEEKVTGTRRRLHRETRSWTTALHHGQSVADDVLTP